MGVITIAESTPRHIYFSMNNKTYEYKLEDLYESIRVYLRKKTTSSAYRLYDLSGTSSKKCYEYIEFGFYSLNNLQQYLITTKLLLKAKYKTIASELSLSEKYISQQFIIGMHKIAYEFNKCKQNDVKNINNIITKRDISTHLYNILQRNGIHTKSDLEGIKFTRFIKFANAGPVAWSELAKYMDKNGINYTLDIDKDEVEQRIIRVINNYLKLYNKENSDDVLKYYDDIHKGIDLISDSLNAIVSSK